MRRLVVALLVLSACSSDAPADGMRTGAAAPGAGAAGSGASSTAGSGAALEPSDFGNAPAGTPVVDAEPVAAPTTRKACNPGFYLGTYSCELTLFGLPLPLMGDVSFNLSVNESVVTSECVSNEFCADLVIAENSGTLYGLAGFYGFETVLDGALDCERGEFRATGIGGRWGAAISSDPSDPEALWTVDEPPLGAFDGDLEGMHEASGVEAIEGTWNLIETASAITCIGPFRVELQP
jgi:hypothetical protein